jgi:hypothetical protein
LDVGVAFGAPIADRQVDTSVFETLQDLRPRALLERELLPRAAGDLTHQFDVETGEDQRAIARLLELVGIPVEPTEVQGRRRILGSGVRWEAGENEHQNGDRNTQRGCA